jgi:hypothetical protein
MLTAVESVAMLPKIPAIWQGSAANALQHCKETLSLAHENADFADPELDALDQRLNQSESLMKEKIG